MQIDIGKIHLAYSSAVFAFYLWLAAFAFPVVVPVKLPISPSVLGTLLVLSPALLLGVWHAPKVAKSGIKSDLVVYIGVPLALATLGIIVRALGI